MRDYEPGLTSSQAYTNMLSLASSTTAFNKEYNHGEEKWHLSYAPVRAGNYSLAFAVPDSDVKAPVVKVANLISSSIETQVVTMIVAMGLSLLVFLILIRAVSNTVVFSVNALRNVIEQIITDVNRKSVVAVQRDKSVAKFQLHVRELIPKEMESCKEISLIKDSLYM